jgi:hypothetical protein
MTQLERKNLTLTRKVEFLRMELQAPRVLQAMPKISNFEMFINEKKSFKNFLYSNSIKKFNSMET